MKYLGRRYRTPRMKIQAPLLGNPKPKSYYLLFPNILIFRYMPTTILN